MPVEKLKGKLLVTQAPDPLAHRRADDPWQDFRTVEKFRQRWEQEYNSTLGKYSRFFLGLEEGKFLATRCPKCGKTWAPPRPVCPDDLVLTRWTELTGEGSVESFSVCAFAPEFLKVELPYVLAYVALDGADTLFCHQLRNFRQVEDIKSGLRVKVAYSQEVVEHPLWLMWFEPI